MLITMTYFSVKNSESRNWGSVNSSWMFSRPTKWNPSTGLPFWNARRNDQTVGTTITPT